jgi:hypothetical protein
MTRLRRAAVITSLPLLAWAATASAECAWAEEMNAPDARLWHPWLRINRVLRVMLHKRWSAEAWAQVRVEFRRALALRSEIRRAGGLTRNFPTIRPSRCDDQ